MQRINFSVGTLRSIVLTNIALILLSVLVVIAVPKPTSGAHIEDCTDNRILGRCFWHGYFTGDPYHYGNGTYVFSTGEPTGTGGMSANGPNVFINKINNRLNGDNKQDRVGAAFIVNTMLGNRGQSFGTTGAGVRNARQEFAEWEQRVRNYDALGLVNWNFNKWYPKGFVNSLWDKEHDDDVFYHNGTSDQQYTIGFINPNNNNKFDVLIKKNCGNIVGDLVGLRDLDYDVRSTLFPGSSSVQAGGEYRLDARVFNRGDIWTDRNVRLRVTASKNASYVNPVTPLEDNMQVSASDWMVNYGYHANSPSTPCEAGAPDGATRTPCWFWVYSDLKEPGKPRADDYVWFNFKISESTPVNTEICFRVSNNPRTSSDNEYLGNEVCMSTVNPREPFVSTGLGGVHAGVEWDDEQCFLPQDNTGSISGRISGSNGSSGDYVVSAGGTISGFGSAGSTGSNLTFGNAPSDGNYGTICRRDFANLYLEDGSVQDLGISTINSAADIPNGIRKRSGNLVINALQIPRGKNSTIVVEGDVLINGNISFEQFGYTSTGNIPAFGLVVTGNIYIHQNVTSLYGLYYAGSERPGSSGIINTCQNQISASFDPDISTNAAACGQSLTVNGAFVAGNIYFRRTGGDVNASNDAAETILYIPQLFLNPPVGLDGLTDQLRDLSERPPVF